MNTQTTKENKKMEETFVEHINKAMLPASGSQSAMAAATAAPPLPPALLLPLAPPLPPPPLPQPSSSKPDTERPAKPEGHVARHKRSGRKFRANQHWAILKAMRSQATILRKIVEMNCRDWGRGGRGRGWGRGRGRGGPHS